MEECCAMVSVGQHFGPSLCPTAAAQARFGQRRGGVSQMNRAEAGFKWRAKIGAPAVGWINLAAAGLVGVC